jgi:lipopolysaccharide export system protein LptC
MVQRDAWSKSVRLMKVVMPLGALAILSTLFLLSRKPDAVMDLSGVDPSDLAQTLANPKFAGVSEQGDAFSLSARAANPDPEGPDRIRIDELNLAVDLHDGSRIEARAPLGLIDMRDKSVSLTGDPVVTTSGGYEIRAANLVIGYGEVRMASSDAIRITGPTGVITADHLALTDAGPGASDYQLVLTGNVHMTYLPPEK